MADNERSEASPFKSRFAEDLWVPPAKYLAENMCDRKARSQGQSLGVRFWNRDPWKREFRLQCIHASSLLKLYDIQAIIRALRTPKGKRVFSLGADFLDPLIQEEQHKLNLDKQKAAEAAATPMQPVTTKIEPPRPAFNPGKSTLDKLRDLDG